MARVALGLLVVAATLTACAKKAAEDTNEASGVPSGMAQDTLGSAEVRDADGKVYGTLYLGQAIGGVSVFGTLQHFPPGEWGMHLHTIGSCADSEFKAAGGHWNPEGRQHGMNNPQGHHFGDLPNMLSTSDSVAHIMVTSMGGKFTGDSTALVDADGGAIVIHIKPDDYTTDPTGNAGARVACGVIVKK